MQAGRLDRRIQLERLDRGVDSTSGEESLDYVPEGMVWAEVRPVSGSEPFASQQRYAEVTHRFRIRYRADVTPEFRIVYQERYFDIVDVLEIGRREGLEIRAVARAE